MYDLFVTGVTDLVRFTQIIDLRKVTRDPLSGIVDGSNAVFFTNYRPVLSSGSSAVYVGATLQAVSAYSFLTEVGEVDFVSPPGSQPYANYTYSSLTSLQINRILLAGFDEMESRWYRGFLLSSGSSGYAAASETDANAFVVDANNNDPSYLGRYFSTERIQVAFYLLCCQYAYYSQVAAEEALSGLSYKESGGMSADTSRRSPNLEKFLERLEARLVNAMKRAQEAWYSDGSGMGTGVFNPQTDDYVQNFRWQQDSKDRLVRNQK